MISKTVKSGAIAIIATLLWAIVAVILIAG